MHTNAIFHFLVAQALISPSLCLVYNVCFTTMPKTCLQITRVTKYMWPCLKLWAGGGA